MGVVKEEIFKIAQEMAKEDAKESGAGNWGWEHLADVASIKLEINMASYLAIATLEYLDGYRVKNYKNT